jgi:hypothetical protein
MSILTSRMLVFQLRLLKLHDVLREVLHGSRKP